MLDPKFIRSNPEEVKASLKKRNADLSLLDEFIKSDEAWRAKVGEFEKQRSRQNEVSSQIAVLKREKKDTDSLMAEMKDLAQTVKALNEEANGLEEAVKNTALIIPNIISEDVPHGKDSTSNKEIRKWGEPKKFPYKPLAHDEIGEALGILDFKTAAKLSGSRFVVLKDLGAKLEMALINFMLDVHTKEHGYTQVMTPYMVNAESMKGTGQLPKFEEDLYKTSDDLYLIPTAEVPVTNIHRDDVLDVSNLPVKYVSYTPCFRREAGSYGKDIKGIIRQHQFNKVELVKFALPENSYTELESLTHDAEMILQKLGLPYRIMLLSSGDMGFSSAKTYDIEVWFPSEGKYKEISSCSNFTDFQARRANIKFKRDPKGKAEFVHTLNGSGLAVGRTFAAILENYQSENGSVVVPEILQNYMQVSSITPR